MTEKAAAEAAVKLTLIDRITGPIKRLQARLTNLSRRIGLDRIGSAVGRLGGSLKGLGDGLARSTGRLSLLVGLLGAGGSGAVVGAFELAKGASELGSEIGEASQKLGIGAVALQEYRFAAKMSGIEAATLGKGIEKLGINAVEARRGNKGLAKDFKSLGVTLKGANGHMRSTEEILNDTMTALAGIEDPLRRNQLAYRLFGKSGVDLVKMLGDGAEGLRKQRHEARLTGNVLSDAALGAADAFGDNLDSLMERIKGLKNLLGVQLLPVMNEMILKTTKWMDANVGIVRSTIVDWVKRFAQVLRDLTDPSSHIRQEIGQLAGKFQSFLDTIKPVVDFLGGPLQATLIAIGAWTAAPLLAALASLASAFIYLGVTIMATPVGWFLAAVAAIAGAAYLIYKNWDTIAKWFSDFWTYVKGLFAAGITYIQSIGGKLYAAGAAMITAMWDGLKSQWGNVVSWLKGAVADLLGWLPESIQKKIGINFSGHSIDNPSPGGVVGGMVAPAPTPAHEPAPAPEPAFVPSVRPVENVAVPETPARTVKLDVGAAGSSIGASIADGFRAAWRDLTRPIGDIQKPGAAPKVEPVAPIVLPPVNAAPKTVTTNEVDAATVKVGTATFPEPLLTHQPQNVDAHMSVTLNISAPGADANEIARVVQAKLQEVESKRAAAAQSSLSD